MEINETVVEKEVIDYDFSFIGGSRLPLTVDIEAGDTFEVVPDGYNITITPKPNFINPEQAGTDQETYHIVKQNLCALLIRKRKQRILTTEELFDLRKFLYPTPKDVQ